MTPNVAGLLALLLYLAIWIGVTIRQIRQCPDGTQVWLLIVIARLYAPFFFSLRIRSPSSLPAHGGGLFISNHRSPVDPMLILSTSPCKVGGHRFRTLEFLTAREYVEMKGVIGWICRTTRAIPVNRNGRDMGPVKEALRRLQAGRLVGIFPEGRINKGEGLLPGNPGVAWLALKAGVPVIPIHIDGMTITDDDMVKPFYTFRHIRVDYGPPIDLREFQNHPTNAATLERVTDHLMLALAKLAP